MAEQPQLHKETGLHSNISPMSLQIVLDTFSEPCLLVSPDGIIQYANHCAASLAQINADELAGQNLNRVFPAIETKPVFFQLHACSQNGLAQTEECFIYAQQTGPHSRWFDLRMEKVDEGIFLLAIEITAKKQAAYEKQIMFELLNLINCAENHEDMLRVVINYLKEWSGCEAIGIRLKDGQDYPYFTTVGFSDEFVQLENHLCAYDGCGKLICDENGKPVIECMCGNIISGRFDPSKSFFTVDGCFWSNCTTGLLANTSAADRQARTRNRCNGSGYESVALIPLRSGGETFGLLQFNDHRINRFTPELIRLYRWIADHIANFIVKEQAETKIGHLNAVLFGTRNVSHLITQEFDRDKLIEKVCTLLVEARGFRSVIIALTDPEGKTILSHAEAGSQSAGKEFSDMFDNGVLPSCAQQVIRTRIMSIQNNCGPGCQNCPAFSPEFSNHSIIVPLTDEKQLYGILLANLPKRMEPSQAETELLQDIANDIAYALRGIEIGRQRDNAMKTAENLARFPAENPNPVMRITPDGKLMYANDSATQLLAEIGYASGEPIPAPIMHSLKNNITGGSPSSVQYTQQERTYLIAVAPITHSGYVNLYWQEITDLIQTRQKLSETEQQLVQSQKLEAIGQLAGGIAHDFNNLLAVQIGYCELMRKKLPEDFAFSTELDYINSCSERAAELTRQLLAFSRKQTLLPVVFDLNHSVQQMEKMLKRLIGENILLHTNLDNSLWHVKADPGQIEQVIMNLVVNARDAMPQGGKVVVTTENICIDENGLADHPQIPEGDYVLLSVSDTGCGMNQQTQQRIFEPFFTTKETGKGTGLGLSTVYGIVSQSCGYLFVDSMVGAGTTFTIYLPQVTEKLTQIISGANTLLTGQGQTILVVEDDPSLRNLFAAMLKDLGYTPTTAATGQEALDLLSNSTFRPTLMITDVIMPKMNGKELAQRVKAICPDIKIIFASGYTDNVISEHGIADPETPFLPKPFRSQVLAKTISELLHA